LRGSRGDWRSGTYKSAACWVYAGLPKGIKLKRSLNPRKAISVGQANGPNFMGVATVHAWFKPIVLKL